MNSITGQLPSYTSDTDLNDLYYQGATKRNYEFMLDQDVIYDIDDIQFTFPDISEASDKERKVLQCIICISAGWALLVGSAIASTIY